MFVLEGLPAILAVFTLRWLIDHPRDAMAGAGRTEMD
jgi:hypothetical protein